MKELFIKCPSCGAVLQVKNSKNEAVKQITCPNCKHRLAVSFEENTRQPSAAPQPLGSLYYGEMPISLQEGINKTQFPGSKYVDLNVVRLADGGSKCIIKAVGTEETVKVNGDTLQKDDQVVLAKGDKLEIGHVALCYDKPCSLTDKGNKPDGTVPTSPSPQSKPKSNSWWPYVAVGMISFTLVVFLLWPKPNKPLPSKTVSETTKVDSSKNVSKEEHKAEEVRKTSSNDNKRKDQNTPPTSDYKSMRDYDLEKLALHGDAKAQYEYGRRLMNKSGSSNIILGLNYLKAASRNGVTVAGKEWTSRVQQLQQKAERGDSISCEILLKID